MEEIQEKETIAEPEVDSDNSQAQQAEGQAEAPSNLILGKFKSVEDLSKAYQELEKHQGVQSEELGSLRQNSAMLNNITQAWDKEKIEKASGFVKYMLKKKKKELTKEENLCNLYYAVDVCGIKMGIMTFGTDGAYVYNGRKNALGEAEPYFKEPYNYESGAVDTTGCGDAWISGFIATYVNGMKQLQGHIGKYEKAGSFLKDSNIEDMENWLIKYSMCVGNMRARATSLLKGAYGCGVTFEEYERKYKR